MTRSYEIHQRGPGERRAIPVGFSPTALLLGPAWLYAQRLVVEGSVALGVELLLAGILAVNQAAWPAYLVLHALTGLVIGFSARHFRSLAAERDGFAYGCTIPARNAAAAGAKLDQVGGEPLPEWRARHLFGVPDIAPRPVRGVLAVTLLTLKAAFRYRLVLVLLALLITAVFVLPTVIKHDGSAQGFTQILLTYTLSAITGLMGFATLWLACGTLARDIDDLQLLLVVVKPIPRWQVWLGKWLGIMALNAGMVGIAGAIVFGLLQVRAGQLAPDQQAKLRNEVLVARAAARVPVPDLTRQVEEVYAERQKQAQAAGIDPRTVRQQIREQLLSRVQAVGPGEYRVLPWEFDLGADARERLQGRPLFLRVKFFTTDYVGLDKSLEHGWEIGAPENRAPVRFRNSFGAETPTEFEIPSDQIGPDGRLVIRYANLNNLTLVFPIEDGIEVLYHEGGFLLNYVRGLCILLCWLGLLAAVGLFSASFLQFPVAAFVSLALLLVGLSGGTLKQVVEQGGIVDIDHETGTVSQPSAVNRIAVSVYGTAYSVLNQISGFSPVGHLSTGRSITWLELARAVAVVIGVGGGSLAAAGMYILGRREIAMPHT